MYFVEQELHVGDFTRIIQDLNKHSHLLTAILTASLGSFLVLLIWYQTLFLPIRIPRDTGAFLTIANGILQGSLPYANLVDHKPPGIYYTIAAALAIEKSIYPARLLLYLTNAATAVLIVLVGRRLSSLHAGLLAGSLYLACLTAYQGLWILTEQFVALWSMATLLTATYADRGQSRIYFIIGLTAGIACAYKQTALLTVIGVLGYFVLCQEKRRNLAYILLGISVPGLLIAIFFLAQDAFDDLLFWTVVVNKSYSGNSLQTAFEIIHLQINPVSLVWIGAVGGLLVSYWKRDGFGRSITGILFVLSLLPLLLRQYGHYFIQPLPFAVLLTALFLDDIAHFLNQVTSYKVATPWTRTCVILIFLILFTPTLIGVTNAHHQATGFSLDDQQAIASDINRLSHGSENLLVVTAEPQYYFLSGRQPLGENVYYLPINRNNSFTSGSVIQELETEQPPVVVLRGCDRSPRICDAVMKEYKQKATYNRGISIWVRT
ncbi:ArnT family glycosyltransferase [Haladaptatus sp. ZSTT2]|uniref:ArnT family glycosyltransferase n=1 Tax=Haladaptatus sp. ZSTT2 TaxID=3120515 RepID=UPI00300ED1AB